MAPTKKSGGTGKSQTSDKVSGLAARALRGEKMTLKETKSMGGSLLRQDEIKGKRPKK